MGSRGRFQGFTSNVIESSATAPQLGSLTRNSKPRPPPLRELPPPSWSSPGHSPPLTSLAPPFSRDMFLFPIKNSVNLSPVSPIYHQSFSSIMSPPITPDTRITKYDQSAYTPLVPSALSTSHLVATNHLDVIDSRLLTVNRCRRRSSMSSFESTTDTIRPWDVRGELTPKPSRAQLLAQAMGEDHDSYSSLMQYSQSDDGQAAGRETEREDRARKMDKKSRLNEKPDHCDSVSEKMKCARRRGETRRTSSTMRL